MRQVSAEERKFLRQAVEKIRTPGAPPFTSFQLEQFVLTAHRMFEAAKARAEKAEGRLAGIGDTVNQELRENYGDSFQVDITGDMRAAIRHLVDGVRESAIRHTKAERACGGRRNPDGHSRI